VVALARAHRSIKQEVVTTFLTENRCYTGFGYLRVALSICVDDAIPEFAVEAMIKRWMSEILTKTGKTKAWPLGTRIYYD